jgi:hypothetical protein
MCSFAADEMQPGPVSAVKPLVDHRHDPVAGTRLQSRLQECPVQLRRKLQDPLALSAGWRDRCVRCQRAIVAAVSAGSRRAVSAARSSSAVTSSAGRAPPATSRPSEVAASNSAWLRVPSGAAAMAAASAANYLNAACAHQGVNDAGGAQH